MSNSLQLTGAEVKAYAIQFAGSGRFPDSRKMEEAFVAIQAGQELGIPPFAAITGIHIIKGKPCLSANVMAGLVKRSERYNYKVVSLTDKACVLEWSENGETVGQSSFTMDDAKRAKLVAPGGNWEKYPSDMLFARALTKGMRHFCPDLVLGGAYSYEHGEAEIPEEVNVTPPKERPQPKPADAAPAETVVQAEPVAEQLPGDRDHWLAFADWLGLEKTHESNDTLSLDDSEVYAKALLFFLNPDKREVVADGLPDINKSVLGKVSALFGTKTPLNAMQTIRLYGQLAGGSQ
jgi:hypothetical protein